MGEIAEVIKAFFTKPGNLSSNSETRMVEGEN